MNQLFKNPLLALAVMASGFEAGLLGIGGGVLLVPCLVYIAKMDQKTAHGTSLSAIMFLAGAGLVGYILDSSVNYYAALFVACGAAIGAALGTWLLNYVHIKYLKLSFGIIASVAAVRLFFGLPENSDSVNVTIVLGIGLFILGLSSGFLSGLLGVGGGIVLVPTMVLLFDFIGSEARGTSLLIILTSAIVGTFRNSRYENVNLKLGIIVGSTGASTAILGAIVSQRISERVVSVVFGVTLLLVAVKMFWDFRQEVDKSA